jgi:hypothetical protein
LQFTNLFASNADVAQFTHSGRDGVSEFVAGDNVIDNGACLVDGSPRVGGKQGSAAAFDTRNFAHVLECQIVSVDVQCVQAGLSSIDVGSVVRLVIPSGQIYARNPLFLLAPANR